MKNLNKRDSEIEIIINKLINYFNVFSINELANKLDISQQAISKWEKNNSINAIKKRCRELEIYDEIFIDFDKEDFGINFPNDIKKTFDYISGWEALNIPTSNGYIADWHPQFYFNEKKELKKYPYNEILKDSGISKRYIPFLNKDEYTANYPRAIADLVYENNTRELQNCVYDFLDDDEAVELFKYLKIINKYKNIEDFMKYELTKLYFKEIKNA
jgi:transcriptional regulator with XRE-family HTH domain